MRNGAAFIGLPEEFGAPDEAAAVIARFNTLAQRETYFARIPAGGWQRWIAHEARIAIALRIVDEPSTLVLRRAAIEQVPEAWRPMVRAYVTTFWKTREIRAIYRQTLLARRAAAAAGRRAA